MSRTTNVDFDSPPINEVVCGAVFQRLDALKTAHIGLLWESYAEEFPKTDDQPPLLRATGSPPTIDPGERRVWFLSEDDRYIVQLQRDRFHFNWRRLSEDDAYPRFEAVYTAFSRHFETFRSFMEPAAQLSIESLELTYVNIVPVEGPGYQAVGSVIPDLPWPPRDFLNEPEGFQWVLEGAAPRGSGARLRVVAQSARRRDNQELVIRLELTVRGLPSGVDKAAMDTWFDAAHETIVYGFLDLTSKEAHARWGRQA